MKDDVHSLVGNLLLRKEVYIDEIFMKLKFDHIGSNILISHHNIRWNILIKNTIM